MFAASQVHISTYCNCDVQTQTNTLWFNVKNIHVVSELHITCMSHVSFCFLLSDKMMIGYTVWDPYNLYLNYQQPIMNPWQAYATAILPEVSFILV